MKDRKFFVSVERKILSQEKKLEGVILDCMLRKIFFSNQERFS